MTAWSSPSSVREAWDFVIARVAIDFRSELRQEDREVIVRCAVTSFGTSSVRTRELVHAADGRLSAEAESVIVARDPRAGRSRPLTEAERTILQEAIDAGSVGRLGRGRGQDPPSVHEVLPVPARS